MGWISIAERLPPIDVLVPFCCWIDDEFTTINFGRYMGEKTEGKAVVMQTKDSDEQDWEPCSHWYELPAPTAPVKAE